MCDSEGFGRESASSIRGLLPMTSELLMLPQKQTSASFFCLSPSVNLLRGLLRGPGANTHHDTNYRCQCAHPETCRLFWTFILDWTTMMCFWAPVILIFHKINIWKFPNKRKLQTSPEQLKTGGWSLLRADQSQHTGLFQDGALSNLCFHRKYQNMY